MIMMIIHFIWRGWHGITKITNILVALYLKNSYKTNTNYE